jgi:hypothetical protein
MIWSQHIKKSQTNWMTSYI